MIDYSSYASHLHLPLFDGRERELAVVCLCLGFGFQFSFYSHLVLFYGLSLRLQWFCSTFTTKEIE